jgi:hypothetical protein
MNSDIKVCPHHEKLDAMVEKHDQVIHRLDKGLVQIKATIWTVGSPLFLGIVVLILKAFGKL